MTVYKRRRIGTIDIGTNSMLLLIAERDEVGKLTILADHLKTPRLGEKLRTTKRISDEALERTSRDLTALMEVSKSFGAVELFITATSAAREATNQDALISIVRDCTKAEPEILPPNEEARLSYISVTSEFGGDAPSMVVDIGGGSTEVTWGLGFRFDGGRSLDLGTVKLIDGPLNGNPPSKAQVDLARKEIDSKLMRITPLGKLDHYFGTAGSFTHLLAVDQGIRNYHSSLVTGKTLTKDRVTYWIDRFASASVQEISTWPGVDPNRADVLLAGSLIIERLFLKFGISSYTVIDRGIRYGKLFDKLRGFAPPIVWA